jgi:ABC-type multidrug transport system fused ATPase/permease subunit
MQRPIAEVALGLGGVGMLAGGGWMILNHRMSLPDFLVFIASMAGLYTPIKGLISAVGELAEFVPCAERTFELLDIKPDIRDAPGAEPCPPLERELAFENVTLDYGRGPVFRGLNLRVRKGEKVGIVGPTGAGKSSLLSLLLRFYDPVSGCVKLDGRDIRQVTLSSLRRQMALVTQDPFLFHAGIEENIRYGRPEATRAEVEEAAKAAAIHDDIAALPEGYATVVGERGVTLSGGQRQRVAVARAILRNAPILLLDEATSALDSATEQQVQAALDRLAAGRTCLVVAHRLSTVKDADRIVVLREDGSVEAVAPHQELLRASPTYARLWAHQTGAEADAQKPGA